MGWNYTPKLPNGKTVPLSWPIAFYRHLNNICWPLEDGVSRWVHAYDRCFWLLGFLVFVQHNDAELRYLRENLQHLDEMLTGMPTYFTLNEIHLRAFPLGLRKERFKRFLKTFYSQIYIDKSWHSQEFLLIERTKRPLFVYSLLYMLALSTFVLIPMLSLVQQRRDMVYQMTPPFSYQPLYVYIPLVLTSWWVGVVVVATLIGEDNLMNEIILHLNGRYRLLREDLAQRTEELLSAGDAEHIAEDFEQVLVEIVKRNIALNHFAQELQQQFTYSIFVKYSFSAGLLCVLGFKAYTNLRGSLGYLLWSLGKIIEMLGNGEVGSTLIKTTNAVSSMYYESQWELVVLRSTNTQSNVRLMKTVMTAMEMNQKPIQLMGLNFFGVSLTTVVSILQGAGSYFTCLIALR